MFYSVKNLHISNKRIDESNNKYKDSSIKFDYNNKLN